ncbi:hypothetical protein AGMMS50293_25390 [Spirochaetia bacterium]|nr:hypothetical protein AGMMS50293_25390 [Spirochaetia bacterium]
MNYEFCLNPLSLPAAAKDDANTFLTEIFRGIAGLPLAESVVTLYSEKKLDETEVSSGWTYYDFKSSLINTNEIDLAGFVLELEDKSPFLEFVTDEEFLKLADYDLRLFETTPLNGSESDIIRFACLHEAILISFPTADIWKKDSLPVAITNISTREVDEISLLNIFNTSVEHIIPQDNWKDGLSANIIFAEEFDAWFSSLQQKNQIHMANLIGRADKMNFAGTDKQTKLILGSSMAIREWRGGCPMGGSGRIRFFYKSTAGKIYILCGFIKTNNDYEAEIRVAEGILSKL